MSGGGRGSRGFGRTWWSQRWLISLESITDPGRLSRGRSYARNGRVLSVTEADGGITARVQGSSRAPYTVHLRLPPLSDENWELLLDALSERASFSARLLNDEMPDDIEDAFDETGISLFPESDYDLDTDCTCYDWANPCKHVAAVYYVLGQRFDDDPFLLFRLRGRTREQIVRALLGSEADEGPHDAEAADGFAPPPDVTTAAFWQAGRPLGDVHISIEPPRVRLPVLRRLGEPPFAAGLSLADRLGRRLDAATEAILALAYREDDTATTAEDAAK
ncbi:MAG: SWIM zinc finger family protein [Anaerolineae bacterium]